jgi:secondary thiamine-phosphate synthase enzyme
METLTTATTCRHVAIRLTTRQPTEFIDLTPRLEQFIADAGVSLGFLIVQTLHTTTAIVVNEHERLLLDDFTALLDRIVPRGHPYRHDDVHARMNVSAMERANGHAHCRALLLPTSSCLNVTAGRLRLGQWQRVFFVELDGPREREISAVVVGEAGQ